MDTTGITIEHNIKGVPILAHINLEMYGGELKDFFASKGVPIEDSPNEQEFVENEQLPKK